MKSLNELQRLFARTNADAFRGLENADLSGIAKEVNALKRWLNSDGTGAPARNHVQEAINRFLVSGRTVNFHDTRLLCYGVIEPVGTYMLIEDQQRLPLLLKSVDVFLDRYRPFRRCYRGLLGGYFAYDPELQGAGEGGKGNVKVLRSYLNSRLSHIQGPGTTPDWVGCIVEHRNLLTSDPCTRYGQAFLDGEEKEFRRVQASLAITDASWFTKRLVLAQIQVAVGGSDSDFKNYINRLLDLLEQHGLLLNFGLAATLTRFGRCSSKDLSPELRDFSVQKWGNPWLSRNSARWSLVGEATRRMVSDWLKLEFIHQFFNLLAEDGNSDRRRLHFWQRYHTHIDDMYFALGPSARNNRSRDFIEVRKKMVGRTLDLTSAGPYENNAFIMCMGRYVVVEFGTKGNACFIFERAKLPFDLSGSVAGNSSELKHTNNIDRLLHIDRSWKKWEEDFESVLSKLMRIKPASTDSLPPGVGRPSFRTNASRFAEFRPPSTVQTSEGEQIGRDFLEVPVFQEQVVDQTPRRVGQGVFSMDALVAYCDANSLQIKDHRSAGGNLWIHAEQYPALVTRQLSDWGFKFMNNKKGWWRSGME
jgi:hypothetical protein